MKKKLERPNAFTYCVTNAIKMLFKYELVFVRCTWPNLCSLNLSLLFISF